MFLFSGPFVYAGSEGRMQHFMKGSMAGLSVLVGQTESAEVISCFYKCKENIEAPPMELLQPGMEILNNNGLHFFFVVVGSLSLFNVHTLKFNS